MADPLEMLPDTSVLVSKAAETNYELSRPPAGSPGAFSLGGDIQNLASISLDAPDDVDASEGTLQGSRTLASEVESGSGAVDSETSVTAAAQDADAASVAVVPGVAEAIQRPSQQEVPIKVWVRDPEKVERTRLGVGSYITYLVKTECSTGAFTDPETEGTAAEPAHASSNNSHGTATKHVYEVRRRFSDFDVLHRLLKSHYRGFFLPPLPDKAFLDSHFAGDSFLAVRKVDLQAYMCTVANHPALRNSPELRWFLTFPGDLHSCPQWQAMLQRPAPMDALLGLLRTHDSSSSSGAGPGASGPHGSGEDTGRLGASLNMMLRMKHSLRNVVQPKAKPELPAEEKALLQAKELLKELYQHLTVVVGVVRNLVSHLEAVSEDFSDLGRGLTHLARFEEQLAQKQGQYTPAGSSAVQRAADLQLLGYSALRQHSVDKQFVLRTGASLVCLHDWWVFIPEVIGSLQEREDALAAVQLLHEELLSKQAAAAKAAAALGPAAAGDKRQLVLLASIDSLQDKLLAARQQYQLLRERNESELLRLSLQRAIDFHAAFARFAQVQAQLAQAMGDVWTAVSEQLCQQQQQQQISGDS